MNPEIATTYGHKVRVRACGMCWQNDALLLVNHKGINLDDFWAPPGGGVEFGETLTETLQREFLEETGLIVTTGNFLFGCEFIAPPLHAVELFFEVHVTGGRLLQGSDPELQIISQAAFLTAQQIRDLPINQLHGIFKLAIEPKALKNLHGFYKI